MISTETAVDNDKILVYSSKRKLLFAALGSLLFIAAGVWMFTNAPRSTNFFLNDPLVTRIIGGLCILVFGVIAIFTFKKISDKRPGLVIDNNGITDNSNAVPAGFVPWQDITGISVHKSFKQKFLVLSVRNPETYINRYSGMKRKITRANYKMTGSPINIATHGMSIKFEELKSLLERRYMEAKR